MKRIVKHICITLFILLSIPQFIIGQPQECIIPLGNTINNTGKIDNLFTAENLTVNIYLKDELKVYSPTAELEELERRLEALAIKEKLLVAKESSLSQREEKINFKEEAIAQTSTEIDQKIKQFNVDIKKHQSKIEYYKELFAKSAPSEEAQNLFQEAQTVIDGASCLSTDYKQDVREFKNKEGKLILGFPIEKLKNDPNFILLGETAEGLTSIKRFNKWGFIDQKGNEVIPHQFDKVLRFDKGVCYVEIGGKPLMIDKKGGILNKLPFNASEIKNLDLEFYWVQYKNKQEGIYDLKQNKLIGSNYLNIRFIKDKKLLLAYDGEVYDLYNLKNGELINLYSVTYLSDFNHMGNAVYYNLMDKHHVHLTEVPRLGIYNWETGPMQNSEYRKKESVFSDLIRIYDPSPIRGFFLAEGKESVYILDAEGKLIFKSNLAIEIPIDEYKKPMYRPRFTLVNEDLDSPYISTIVEMEKKGRNQRARDGKPYRKNITDGQLLYHPGKGYHYLLLVPKSSQSNKKKKEDFDKYGYVSVTNEKIHAYRPVDENNLMPVMLSKGNKNWSLLNFSTGKLITKSTFQEIKAPVDGIYSVRINDIRAALNDNELWKLINKNGKFIIDETYSEIGSPVDGIYPVRPYKKWTLLTNQGVKLTYNQFDSLRIPSEGIYPVAKSGKWAFLTKDGFRITDFKYESVGDFKDGFAIVSNDGIKYGIINRKGAEIIPPVFDTIRMEVNFFSAVKNEKLFEIAQNGRCLITCDDYKKILTQYYQNQAK